MATNLITTKEAAAQLGVSVSTISRMVATDRLKAATKLDGLRGAYLFRTEDIDELAEAS